MNDIIKAVDGHFGVMKINAEDWKIKTVVLAQCQKVYRATFVNKLMILIILPLLHHFVLSSILVLFL